MRIQATTLAESLKNILVLHAPSGNYLLEGYDSLEEARDSEGDSNDEINPLTNGYDFGVQEYDLEECVQTYVEGFTWPLELGLVEEVEDDSELITIAF
jgi:hypothetical protein